MINDVLNFLKQNYHDKEIVIFDIGAADLGDSIQYKHEFPNSKVFSFECNNDWLENNIKKSIEHGIYYNHGQVVCVSHGKIHDLLGNQPIKLIQ